MLTNIEFKDGLPLIVTTFTTAAFSPEMYKWYDTKLFDLAHVVDSKTRFWKLEEAGEGF